MHFVWTFAFSNVKKQRDHNYVITIGVSYTLKKLYSSSTYRVCKTLKYRPKRFSLAFIYAYLKGPNINIYFYVWFIALPWVYCIDFTNIQIISRNILRVGGGSHLQSYFWHLDDPFSTLIYLVTWFLCVCLILINICHLATETDGVMLFHEPLNF